MLGNLSLRYKFLLILGAILVAATLAYFALAIQLFNTDKRAYVFDSNGALVETLGEEMATGILSSLKTMRLSALAQTTASTDEGRLAAVKTLFDDDDNFVILAIHKVDILGAIAPPYLVLSQGDYLNQYDLKHQDAVDAVVTFSPTAQALTADGLQFQNASLKGRVPLLGVALSIKDETGKLVLVASAFLRQDRRFALFHRSSLYTTYLIDGAGNVLVHSDPAMVKKRASFASSPFVQSILASKVAKGVSEYQDPPTAASGEQPVRMIAYKKLGIGGLVAVSEIPRERAFLASRRLIEKSALFAVLILAVAFVISLIFSRRLTAALNRLYLATDRVAKGDFNVEVSVTSQDEVGALSRSFNHMTKEITRLLAETADKARMERELETAQLVQDNFFPKGDLSVHGYEVSSYFSPASECGGDWWGSLTLGRKLVLLIGDATGHGVPAALITAAAHSCAMTLERMSHRVKDLELSPAFILDMLNASIFHAGQGRVKMTFFVVVLDTDTGGLEYANASHEQPFIGRIGRDNEVTMDSLSTKPDACLGESLTTRFTEHRGDLCIGDALVLYTDGLSESRNLVGDDYGDRRLTRILKTLGGRSASEVKELIVADVQAFVGNPHQTDDITVVVVRRPLPAQTLNEAS